ncbi:MAG: thiol-disulfide isomerase-like thioredoxin [Phycisphaerales bacterium]|nr:thiol-disulfide isomerase-like thioredoxin [Phycisphaerales bacterium]
MTLARMLVAGGLGVVLVLGPVGRAEDVGVVKVEKKELLTDDHAGHDKPATKPAPAAAKKVAVEVKVSPEAKAELAKVTEAYQKLGSLEVAGTMSSDISAGGEVQNERASFEGSFVAPNKFRHEMKGDIVVGSTGEKFYAFRPARNDYKVSDAAKERVAWDKLPNPMRDVLQMQNPGLMCAVVEDAGKFLVEGVKEVSKGADVMVAGKSYAVLMFVGDKMDYRVLLDPETHLVRQVVTDLKRSIQASGRDDVERAWVTVDYTTVKPAASVAEGALAWSAPQGAKDAATAPDADEHDASALVGKDAPDFKLNGMDDKPVTMAELKGSVVVLDFWATWCGPCKASLPGLNKIYVDLKEKGLKVYAVDLEEPKETIQPVAAKLIPDLTVLLDENSAVSKKYGVSGIPQTVVIGKDGRIKKVFIGSGNEAKIRAAVEGALGE